MGELLKTEQLKNSFYSVNKFLQHGNFSPIDHHFNLILKVNARRQRFNGTFEIECKDFLNNESYLIYSDVFKANEYYRPVWSAYLYIIFHESTGELKSEIEGIKHTLKH